MSTTEKSNCSLSSFLSMSCRERAQEFARHLHSRLSSLDTNGSDGCQVNENSWLGSRENSIAVSNQPRQSADNGFNGFYESPESPQEEINETPLINSSNLGTKYESVNGFKTSHLKECETQPQRNDSDSSNEIYYDSKSELNHNCINGKTNSLDEDESYASQLSSIATNHTNLSVDNLTNSHNTNETDNESHMTYERQDTQELIPETVLEINSTCDILQELAIEEPEIKINGTNGTIPVINCILNDELNLSNSDPVKNNVEESSKPKQNYLDVALTSVEDYEDEVESEPRVPRVRRCSSLKTGKTPPGTPRKKKIVHFADVLGLELTNVRSFLDEIPKIPTSAFDDLTNVDVVAPAVVTQSTFTCQSYAPERILCAMFQQPGGQLNFFDILTLKNVCLENAMVDDPIDLAIRGTVRVRNLDFHKSVFIRYSLDGWKTHADLQAKYVENSCDGFSDKFSFLLYAHTLRLGQTLEFAVRFHCKGTQYWDNNYGANYCFQCLPASKHVDHLGTESFGDNWDPKFYYESQDSHGLPTSWFHQC